MSRLVHENAVARGKQIGERGLPGARPRRRVDEDMGVGLEDALDLCQDALAQFLKLRSAMIDHGHVHRPQDPLGDRARPRNLQEMPARPAPFVAAHLALPPKKGRPSHFDLASPLGTFNTERRNSRMGGSVAGLERALSEEGVGEVQFDAFARGRYATDASSYQIMPLGVVIPGSIEEATRALSVARSRNVPVLPRGGGTSQSGQTVNAALVVDCSKRLTRILSLDTDAAALSGRARRRARRAQSPAEAYWLMVPGRHLDGVARDDRRHGGQQFLRRPIASLRHDARQRDLDRRRSRRRFARAFRRGSGRSLRPRRRRPAPGAVPRHIADRRAGSR